jgi:glycine/D-amino acid oxidase-like deaminating enzyme
MTRGEMVETFPGAAEELRWPGAVVIGGGGTALLTALELEKRGVPALVIEQGTLCSGQTGQCHGWLHRGGVFPDARMEDLEQLNMGARRWGKLIQRSPEPHSVLSCYVGGQRKQTYAAVTGVWEHLGLAYHRSDTAGDACNWLLGGPESAVVPLDVLRAALVDSSVVLRSAQATSFIPDHTGAKAESLLVKVGQRILRLHADSFVLANGAGISAVLPDPNLSSLVTGRLSFMLVVRSSAVVESGIAIPEQEALGLFAVPRKRNDSRSQHLLLSNFMSYAPSADITYSRANWLAGIRPTLKRFLPEIWDDLDALWGIYTAVKVEPRRRLALGVSNMAVLPTFFDNVVAGVPGKLVLAPLLAEQLADAVAAHTRSFKDLSGSASAADALLDQMPPAQWGPEEWEVTPLVRRASLFEED